MIDTKHPSYAVLTLLILLGLLPACSQKTAEEKGKEMADEKIGMVKGIGESLKAGGKQAAESMAHGAGNTVQGIGAGMEASSSIAFKTSAELAQSGLGVSRIQWDSTPDAANGVVMNAYMNASKEAKGRATLFAYTKDNVEVGRTSHEINMAAGSAAYENFTFDKRTPRGSIAYVTVGYSSAAKK